LLLEKDFKILLTQVQAYVQSQVSVTAHCCHVWWLLPCERQLPMRTVLFWVIMPQAVVIYYWQVVLTLEDGTDTLSQNVGKKLPLLSA